MCHAVISLHLVAGVGLPKTVGQVIFKLGNSENLGAVEKISNYMLIVNCVLTAFNCGQECQTIRPLDNSPRTIRPRSSDDSPPIFRQLAPNMNTSVLRWANIFLCSLSSNFLKEEERLLFKADFQSVLRTLESLFTTFVLFHVRRHKM